MFLIFTLLCIRVSTVAAQDHVDFWYSTAGVDEFTSSLCQVSLPNNDIETCVNVPAFSTYAISPDHSMIALRANYDGQIHLLNTSTQNLTSLELCQPNHLFLWDEHYYDSGTLTWSPDARYLAFTGVTTLSCDTDDQANVYIYDTLEESLSNLTADVSVTRSSMIPSSWSPDGEWLILYGVQSISNTGELNWGSALISREGTDFREIAPHYKTCRLVWSPDMKWLTSNTACRESIGTGSDLVFIPFDFEVLPNATEFVSYIDDVISPLHFGYRPTSGWTSQYTSPIWIDNEIAIAYRTLSAISGGYLTQEEMENYSSKGIVAIDLATMTETMIFDRKSAGDTTKIGNWFISRQDENYWVLNPITKQEFVLPAAMIPCVVQDSVQISNRGNYIAIVHNCSLADSEAHLFVYNVDQLDMPLLESIFDTPQVNLLGFSS